MIHAHRPLVYFDDGFYVFTDRNEPHFQYDFEVDDVMDKSFWINHMSDKNWVTPEHIAEFKRLVETYA